MKKKIKNLKKEGKHLQNKKCEFWKPLGEAWSLNKHVGQKPMLLYMHIVKERDNPNLTTAS